MSSTGVASPVAVRDAGGRFSDDLRAVRVVWKRELIRFSRNRTRIVTALVQPVLYLFVLGTGLSAIVRSGGHFNFRTFMFPGVVGMTILFTAMFSAISIVWDREFGFLREMLVAPVRRWALVVGKCLGGASVATIQAAIMLLLAGAVGIPYAPVMIITLLGEMILIALLMTAFGVLVASRMQRIESFQVVMQFIVLPMFFLSGAIFPLSRLPTWLAALTKFDPLTYAIDPMRRTVFEHLSVPPAVARAFDPGVSWNGWHLPLLFELALVAAAGVGLLGAAVGQFSRTE